MRTRIAYYPLWQASRDGQVLETRRGPVGDLEVRVSGGAGPIELKYGPALPEFLGALTSADALLLWLVWAVPTRGAGRLTPG